MNERCPDCNNSGVVPIGEEQGQILYSECPTCKKHNPMKIVATEQEIEDAIIEEAFKVNSSGNLREDIRNALKKLPTLKDELEAFRNHWNKHEKHQVILDYDVMNYLATHSKQG